MRSRPDWFLVLIVGILAIAALDAIVKREVNTPMLHLQGKASVVFGVVVLILMLIGLAWEFSLFG